MLGISDDKGIPNGKLVHIFLGTVKNGKPGGYHCAKNLPDEILYAEAHLYPKSKRMITVNREQKVFEAIVRERGTGKLKEDNCNKSSFFDINWSRQDVVDCINRVEKSGKILKEYKSSKIIKKNIKNVCVDPQTGLIVVNQGGSCFPLIKY